MILVLRPIGIASMKIEMVFLDPIFGFVKVCCASFDLIDYHTKPMSTRCSVHDASVILNQVPMGWVCRCICICMQVLMYMHMSMC